MSTISIDHPAPAVRARRLGPDGGLSRGMAYARGGWTWVAPAGRFTAATRLTQALAAWRGRDT